VTAGETAAQRRSTTRDQSQTPVLDALADYRRQGRYGFTPPGHRQGRFASPASLKVLGAAPFQADVLAASGLDDRRSRGRYLERAEELMADAVGADHAFFSTCGSSLSVKAAMLAVAGGHPGGLLVGRDSHKSIVAGLIFCGVRPRWVTPRWDAERHLSHPPSPQQVEQAWQDHPDAAAALIVSPSPYGTCADLVGIAEVCHRRGKPLIVDEAWGAHLPFHPELPTWAMDAGADVCVVSVHKMGGGFEQGSVFHHQGELVEWAHLSACADLLMTTSPSVPIYAALDGWRHQMVHEGHALLESALRLANDVRARIDSLPGLHVLDSELCGHQASYDLDRMQILIDVSELGVTGYQSADWMREVHDVDVGMADHRRILATLSVTDDVHTTERLIETLRALSPAAASMGRVPHVEAPTPGELELATVMAPHRAFFGPTRQVPAKDAAGCVAAEQLTPYPPGIPAVVPGERLNAAVIDYLRSGLAAGMAIPDATDPTLGTFRCVASE
jgi:arginine/lysine/ornithine decarboxylase